MSVLDNDRTCHDPACKRTVRADEWVCETCVADFITAVEQHVARAARPRCVNCNRPSTQPVCGFCTQRVMRVAHEAIQKASQS